jgi:hypothetical protein
MNWKEYGRKQSLRNLKYYPSIYLEKLRRTSVRTAGLRIDIRNRDALNTKLESYPLDHVIRYNIAIKEIGLEVVDWINLSQDTDQWWALSMRIIKVKLSICLTSGQLHVPAALPSGKESPIPIG